MSRRICTAEHLAADVRTLIDRKNREHCAADIAAVCTTVKLQSMGTGRG